MSKTKACLWLSRADRSALEEWVSGRNTPQKLVWRARIILLSADRIRVMAITRAVGMSKVTVARWQERYLAKGIAGLQRDASRPGRLKPLSADTIERVVHKTLHEKPPGGTRWSIRKMAKASGLSYSSVQRIWKAHELKPHRVKTFKLSNDKHFAEKVQDIVGLYLNPPDKALVFSVDEKSQIQALDRTQPGLPLKKGRCGTMTHDYKRHGTTTLFAALDVATGKVIGQCMTRHRHQEWLNPAPDRGHRAKASRYPPDRRQLCHPQAPRRARVVEAAQAVSHALHADLRLLAQPGRAVLRPDHRRSHPRRRV
jgi:transposase